MKVVTESLPGAAPNAAKTPPLVLDLDGTVLKTDLLLEALLILLKQQPRCLCLLVPWLVKGKAYFKQQIAAHVSLDVTILPFREDLLDYVRDQRAAGRTIVLATSNDKRLADTVAGHLKLFDVVLASDGTTNLSGKAKRDRLVSQFGEKRFDYAGNESRDLAVWSASRKALVVNAPLRLGERISRVAQVERVFARTKMRLTDHLSGLRIQHWLKNTLVFVPILAAHRINEASLVWRTLLAFVAFGFLASAGYVANDLLDLPADRCHPTKRYRHFAAGDLPLWYAFLSMACLTVAGCAVSALVSFHFLEIALAYFVLSLGYSLHMKNVVILDVIVLAGFYTMRIMAGSVASGIAPSHWLLAFSTFLFLSLALVKRYGELAILKRIQANRARARAYEASDSELLATMGIASGYLAVLVLALYINSDTAQSLYGHYQLIWFLCPLLLYWVTHVWLVAHRGKMPEDPVLFAVTDGTSRILMVLMLMVGILAL